MAQQPKLTCEVCGAEIDFETGETYIKTGTVGYDLNALKIKLKYLEEENAKLKKEIENAKKEIDNGEKPKKRKGLFGSW